MPRSFDASELLRVAVRDERGGQQLYTALADLVANEQLRETFRTLAGQEKDHERRFQGMLDDLGPQPMTGQYPDEYVDYLESVAQQGGRDDPHTLAGQIDSDIEAIELAVRFEREQLALQKDIADILGDRARDVIDVVLSEERAHLVQLTGARRQLTGG